jgi:gamma-glutamylcyclotransferase (GGCT)/AIG2-like uncharacterized protein YtfP
VPALKPLFAYGTFRRAAWRSAILGADYPERPATLRGYRRVACASGYLSLRETARDGGVVEGVLVDLDELGWRIADRWEEVPSYARTDVVAETADGPIEAVTYVCRADEGGTPLDDERCALIPDTEVEAAIDRFAPLMRAIRRGKGDAFGVRSGSRSSSTGSNTTAPSST